MRSNLPILSNFQVASPCDASWEEMAGDDQKRFCGKCEKHVYNLPLLSPDELVDLIERTEGKFCGRLFARTDGTVLTADCPVGHAAKLARARRKGLIGASAVIAALCFSVGASILATSWGGCEITQQPEPHMLAGEVAPVEPPPPEPPPVPMLGVIAPVEPPKEEPIIEEPQIKMGKIRIVHEDDRK